MYLKTWKERTHQREKTATLVVSSQTMILAVIQRCPNFECPSHSQCCMLLSLIANEQIRLFCSIVMPCTALHHVGDDAPAVE